MKRFLAVAVVAILALPATALAQKQHGVAKAAPVAAKIANAETAAPAEISSHATILDYPSKAGGALVKLRAGTNGWVCLPDDPATQGNDPGCFDGVWQEWMKAFMAKTKPTITRVGVSYMTAPGGAPASAKDPWAAKATPTNDWGFDGLVVSDWAANHTIFESVQGGLDLEMPGPAKYYGPLLEEAVQNWQIAESVVDEAVRRVLKLLIRTGKLDGKQTAGSVNTIEHQQLAREVAAEAIVLLKNYDAVLPLDLNSIKSIAAIGPGTASLDHAFGWDERNGWTSFARNGSAMFIDTLKVLNSPAGVLTVSRPISLKDVGRGCFKNRGSHW